mmetsp:Transcript_43124/g.113278  ORF Transcript_43124/g.113278 Transcript_43124/m.113278 type:complete len:284 (-) Transcript_43124:1672-2523(-)
MMLLLPLVVHTTVYVSRRLVAASVLPMSASCRPAHAAPQPFPQGFEPPRIEGIGGGVDVLSDKEPAVADVVYPPSLNGIWLCQRRVVSVEGDSAQAEGAWRLLGGYGDDMRSTNELYSIRYIPQPAGMSTIAITSIDGQQSDGVVLDRGFELAERVHGADVSWDRRTPNSLGYQRSVGGRGSAAQLKVIQRSIELPNEQGWGSNELVRIATDATTVLGSFEINYAARVQRRWRRARTESGDRVVEGLEIVKTYRVLDGVAGVEYPTSTHKSTIRLQRPKANPV